MVKIRYQLFLLIVVSLLAACDALTPIPPTLTPEREFSAPTLQPSPTVMIAPPTSIPENFVDRGQSNPVAAGLPAHSVLPPMAVGNEATQGMQPVQIPFSEDVIFGARLYENPPVQLEQGLINPRLPGVLLIGAPPNAWGTFPADLRDAGFTVLVVDMLEGMTPTHLAGLMRSFSETPTVNPGLMSAIGAEQGATLALLGCAMELLCDAVTLISPREQTALVDGISTYNPRPLLVTASRNDSVGFSTAQALQTASTGEFFLQPYDNSGRGVEILTNQPELTEIIAEWLHQVLVE